MRNVTLVHDLPFQRWLAVKHRNQKKYNYSNDVRKEFGKEAFLHTWFFERDKINLFEVILFMRWLLFLSRLAFICNCFFLLAVSLQLTRWFQNQDAEATTIIIGYFMAALLNPAAILCYLVLFFANKNKLQIVPTWIIILNILFLFFQLFYLFHLNAQ